MEETDPCTKLSERKEVFGPGFMNPRVQKKLAKQQKQSETSCCYPTVLLISWYRFCRRPMDVCKCNF